ncbi:MAG: ATP-binding protein [Lachnospiraceae bacterium]|nr:ATP-binding protein [Lachnospiraceae bacterium]
MVRTVKEEQIIHAIKREKKAIPWNIICLVILLGLANICMLYTYKIMLQDARKMGREIVQSYSGEEEQNLTTYRNLINFGAAFIEKLALADYDSTQIRSWAEEYFHILEKTAGKETVDFFVIKGEEVLVSFGKEVGDFDVTQTEWYQTTLESDESIVYTDAYYSALYEHPVVTISKMCGDTGWMLSFAIFPENLRFYTNEKELSEGSEYFMCDSKGVILYAEPASAMRYQTLDPTQFSLAHAGELEKLRNGETPAISYTDEKGQLREVFYHELPNGWCSVLTIPKVSMMKNWYVILKIYCAVFFGIALVMGFIYCREIINRKKTKKIKETVYMLGDSYYALYRVNLIKKTYEVIKTDDLMKNLLGKSGKYSAFCRDIRQVIHEDVVEEFIESFSIENMQKQIENHVKEFGGNFKRQVNGRYQWVNVSMLFAPIFSKDEVVLCFRLIEKERRRELDRMQLLEHSIQSVKDSQHSQYQFFSNMSHDMRTPLNVIIGMSELAEKNIEDKEKTADYINKISRASKQLLDLINDILDISRIKEKFYLEKKPFSLHVFLEETLDVFRIQAQQQGKNFNTNCKILHDYVYADDLRLKQILNNLLSNALKFTKEGESITVDVTEIVDSNNMDSVYQFVITDTGRGMSEKFLEHIFEAYERERRFASQVTGTGLGMAIVKSIVTMAGGEITVQSEVEKGTTFVVTLPMKNVGDQQIDSEEKPDKAAQVNNQDPEQASETCQVLKGFKLLLVEDYELNMEIGTEILQMNGAEVLQATNGKEAIERFGESKEGTLDAILMDMQMPVMDGCEAAKHIRNMERADAKTIPIIALTANAFPEDIAQTQAAGMNAHITKPIDTKILFETLKQLCES